MKSANEYRRALLKGVVGGAAIQCLPKLAFAQSTYRIRQEWQQFKKTPQYQSFLTAIAAMKKNTNPSSRGSLQYWANVHQNFCPHGLPYFVSWHRGYLYYFEQQLQIASGDSSLNLPYWDYYSYATLPTEFTDPTSPLYQTRLSANVYNALDLSPFGPTVYNFQRGTANAFEPMIENAPHNPVHDLLGGIMSTMQSPMDPIFYLHHANIDRLTHAWALPSGKGIPLSAFPYSSTNSDPYWAGINTYATDLTIDRYLTLIPTWLGDDYANDQVPTSLPPLSTTAQVGAARLPASPRLPSNQRPAFQSFNPVSGQQISSTRRSLTGAAQLDFDEQSASILLGLKKSDANEVATVIAKRRNARANATELSPGTVNIVVDRPMLSGLGSQGGYFYALYLNMPASITSQTARTQSLLTNLGPYQIAAASHHGPAQLQFDATDLLAQQNITDFSALSLSWVRVDGDSPPAGKVIDIDQVRVELAYDPVPVQAPAFAKPAGWYRSH